MFTVIENKEVGPNIFQLVLKFDNLKQVPQPGQFFNLKISQNESLDPLLRRPLSVFDFEAAEKRLEFVYRVVGKGTRILARTKVGNKLDLLGPLGNPFSLAQKDKELNLIGGGMGIAPLYYLAKKLKDSQPKVYLGTASKAELKFFESKFKHLGLEYQLAAVEEKLDIKGTALDLWLTNLQKKPDFVYCCGPEKLLAAVEKHCLEKNIAGEISVEKRMGCGIGVCLSCSCQTKSDENKNKRACVEGPVFAMGEVVLSGC